MSTPAYSTAMALLQLSLVAAYPIREMACLAQGDASPVGLGGYANHWTIVVVFCMSYAFLLALAQGEKFQPSFLHSYQTETATDSTKAIEQAK